MSDPDGFYLVTHTDADGKPSDVETEISSLESLIELIGPNESVSISWRVNRNDNS